MKIKSVLNVILFLGFYPVISLAGVADLSFDAQFDGIEDGVVFGQQGTFSVTVTNNGPDAAGVGSGTGFPIAIFSGFVELSPVDGTEMDYNIDRSITQNCIFGLIAVDPRPGNPPGFTFFFETPEIAANESVTCYGVYYVNFKAGSRTYEWRASGFVEDTDPDFTNNFKPITFSIKPKQVPALSFYGLLTMILAFLFTGYITFRQKTTITASDFL